MPGVVAALASVVEVAASVAVASLVLVAAWVAGGTLVLGTLVGSSAPQAANTKEAKTNIVKIKLAFFIRTSFLSLLLFSRENFYSRYGRFSYLNEPGTKVELGNYGFCVLKILTTSLPGTYYGWDEIQKRAAQRINSAQLFYTLWNIKLRE
jgi:hypothetical protein